MPAGLLGTPITFLLTPLGASTTFLLPLWFCSTFLLTPLGYLNHLHQHSHTPYSTRSPWCPHVDSAWSQG